MSRVSKSFSRRNFSELVSGFNVEYGGGLFALIFIAEYAIILALAAARAGFALGAKLGAGTLAAALILAFFWV